MRPRTCSWAVHWVRRVLVPDVLGWPWRASFPQASVLEWMPRTLNREFEEWFREKEPKTDHQGFFQSDLPTDVIEVGPRHHGSAPCALAVLLACLGPHCACCSSEM